MCGDTEKSSVGEYIYAELWKCSWQKPGYEPDINMTDLDERFQLFQILVITPVEVVGVFQLALSVIMQTKVHEFLGVHVSFLSLPHPNDFIITPIVKGATPTILFGVVLLQWGG